MHTVNRLTQDHRLLHAKLEMLKGAIPLVPQSWLALREVCFTLSHLLQAHSERESEVMASYRWVLEDPELIPVLLGHQSWLQSLQILNRCFVDEPSSTTPQELRRALVAVVDGLSEELDIQEDTLFPLLERVMASEKGMGTETHTMSPVLNEEMTISTLVKLYPETKPVLTRFFINPMYENYDCLDEVAWRHGVPIEELLKQLEQARRNHASQTEASGRQTRDPVANRNKTGLEDRQRNTGGGDGGELLSV